MKKNLKTRYRKPDVQIITTSGRENRRKKIFIEIIYGNFPDNYGSPD